ncbi:hypothetical protein CY35_04G095700 [Sphagnum magellanicum]|nr:hypothetical protein CY35_04G095700 [Sphagnum magellanicum]
MASPSQFRRLAATIWCRNIGYGRGIRTVAASFLVVTREPSSSGQTGNEDFASKILSEMRGRREEESSSNGNTGAQADSGSSYLAELTMRGLKARASDSSSQTESPLQKLAQLSRFRGSNQGPGYAFLPPKEDLLEKYYSEEHLSAMEKHKLELQKVREEFRIHEGDCGSSQVQIALLTAKIKYMAEHMKTHKKDLHSRRGLEGMIEQRKKLLQYLRQKDWDEYCILISKLGLRDKPSQAR